ncbi:MAG TPA: hypothetical protein VK632_15400, partial [Verrucomicrobiae bacterium]|nr:hypothetical protein [Verrucomicrobiae bacterium]
ATSMAAGMPAPPPPMMTTSVCRFEYAIGDSFEDDRCPTLYHRYRYRVNKVTAHRIDDPAPLPFDELMQMNNKNRQPTAAAFLA